MKTENSEPKKQDVEAKVPTPEADREKLKELQIKFVSLMLCGD